MTATERIIELPGATLALAVHEPAPDAPTPADPVPFLLVHGLASNARTWDGVAARLVARGHQVVAVDQRGHGRSPETAGGYDTPTCASDLADLVTALGWTGERTPVVAGQSWGANVVLELAAAHDVTRAVALVDGGWISLGRRFATFEACWAQLAPPVFDDLRFADVEAGLRQAHRDWPAEGIEGTLANLRRTPDGGVRARLAREHHRDIVRSLWERDASDAYPRVRVPLLAVPAGSPGDDADDPLGKPAAVTELLAAVPTATARWYPGADHDVHCQHPGDLATDLLDLAARSAAPTTPAAGATKDGAR